MQELNYIEKQFKEKRYIEIIKFAEKNINRYQDNVFFLKILGHSFFNIKQFKDSIICYKNVSKLENNFDNQYNLVLALSAFNKLKEAEGILIGLIENYKLSSEQKSNVNLQLGNIYLKLQKYSNAISNYQSAISLNKNYLDAYNNLGYTYILLNENSRAVQIFKELLNIKKNYIPALNNLANIDFLAGNYAEAEKQFLHILEIDPGFVDALSNLSLIELKKSNYDKSFKYLLNALEIDPDHQKSLLNITILLNLISDSNFNSEKISKIIIKIIQNKIFYRPEDLIGIVKKLLLSNQKLEKLSSDLENLEINELINKITDIPIFLWAIKLQCPITDITIENLLKKIRLKIIENYNLIIFSNTVLDLFDALATYFFQTEYIINFNSFENKLIHKLSDEIKISKCLNDNDIIKIHILAMYQKLYDYSWSEKIKQIPNINLIQSQILDFEKENRIKSELKIVSNISDKISKNVQNQYEENPYPRWTNYNPIRQPKSVHDVFTEINLNYKIDQSINFDSPNILIAGCGTGRHAISSHDRFLNSKLTGIDISQSSLAYAQRKIIEANIQNIQLFQCDILNVDQLSVELFDIIESVGVLHHMSNPEIGLRKLCSKLKNNGFFKLGLYSKTARSKINIYREKYSNKSFFKKEDLIDFRDSILLEESKLDLYELSDFYSLSEFRDLICHVQEHQFNLVKIQKMLIENNLKFIGFEITNNHIIDLFKEKFGEKNILNLNLWNEFELLYPNTFIGMYQFWCQKVT